MKEITQNEYNKSINKVVDFINNNLHNVIDLKRLAAVANISEFHFHRIFKAFIGETLGSYISRLRLERAARILQTSNNTLEIIADRTGYQTAYSLSKAFKKHFGISPSAFRNIENFFSQNTRKEKLQAIVLNPKITDIEKMELVYIRIISKYGAKQGK